MKNTILLLILSTLFLTCSNKPKQLASTEVDTDYWAGGKAEISVYELSQNRYDNNHPGKLIFVFVSEDFLTDKQVKNESYTSKNSTSILKNIQIKKFTTGIYDYSIFTSVFTPWDRKKYPSTFKTTNSMQEWCGTKFLQLNLEKQHYKVSSYSYFEKEGDQFNNTKKALLEDELFTLIRMHPSHLQTGEFLVIPNSAYVQLMHKELKAYPAKANLKDYTNRDLTGKELKEYTLNIKDLNKSLSIVFENTAPYRIIRFSETYPSAFDGKLRTTKATLKKQKKIAYWNENNLGDEELRKDLGLE